MFQNGIENLEENIKTSKYGTRLREPFKYLKARGKTMYSKLIRIQLTKQFLISNIALFSFPVCGG